MSGRQTENDQKSVEVSRECDKAPSRYPTALAHSVRDRLIERWHDTQMYFKRKDPKRIYFLSLEFLMGRSLSTSIINLGIRDQYADALSQLGFEFEILAEQDFYELWPHKFQYKTNGVTQHRWIVVSNPGLCALISKWLGTEAWIHDVDLLTGLRDDAANGELRQEWKMVKKVNKIRLAEYIEAMSGLKFVKIAFIYVPKVPFPVLEELCSDLMLVCIICNLQVSLDAMVDMQTKRIHEYKRRLLNILGIIHRYDCIKNMGKKDRVKVVPCVCIIGGIAAPGYETAKQIIKLCHAVAEKINNNSDIRDLLKLVFIPDYNVSVAELVIPGADLSQHISTAGHETSGTSSMKFLMNGCLLLATKDGSTVEIIEEIVDDNMCHCVTICRMIRDGYFGFKDYFKSLCDDIEGGHDYDLLGAEFKSYLEAQAAADKAFVDQERWTQNEYTQYCWLWEI
ncbi:hypothetical protein POUND7_002796 [Theobroma cacao]